MKQFEGKWALVTGASRGVGQQIARALAEQGCRLILHSRQSGHTKSLAQEIRSRGNEVIELEAELSNSQAVTTLIEDVRRICSAPAIIYNNAAIMTPYHQDWCETVVAEYELSFRVNTIAPILISNAFLPAMVKTGWGRIVNLTSGIKDQPELTAYAISKAALDKYVYDAALKLKGTGVTMNLLDPGWLRTDLGGPQAPGAVESVLAGALVPLFEQEKCGVFFRGQDYV